MIDGILVLDDGTVFEGKLFGAMADKAGEMAFTTGGVDGYQEMITDPASKGKMIVFASPCIGNYGIVEEFNESDRIYANGIIVGDVCMKPSPQYGGKPLDEFLAEHGATGITGVDTRELIIKLRRSGRMNGAIVRRGANVQMVLYELNSMVPVNPIKAVSIEEVKRIDECTNKTLAIIDCGINKSLLDAFKARANVILLPYDATPEEILGTDAKGLVISGGPGSPMDPCFDGILYTIKKVGKRMPILGLSLGCEILARALGVTLVKMDVGHHGNQPVEINGRICMTNQSHDYCIDRHSIASSNLNVTQVNLNDGTIEAFRHRKYPIYGYEYHIEGVNDPDIGPVFDEFMSKVGRMEG